MQIESRQPYKVYRWGEYQDNSNALADPHSLRAKLQYGEDRFHAYISNSMTGGLSVESLGELKKISQVVNKMLLIATDSDTMPENDN